MLSAAIPRAIPTPSTAPTSVCVVEIGKPVPEAITTVEAAASSAAKPRLGVKCVIPSPIVLITFLPKIARPATIPKPPSGKIHHAIAAFLAISPLCSTMFTTAASGPIALATSFEPCAKAIQHAVSTISTANTFSTLLNCIALSALGSIFRRAIAILPITATTTAIAIESA